MSSTPPRTADSPTPQEHLEAFEHLLRKLRLAQELAPVASGSAPHEPIVRRLERMHPADVAYVLENLPLDDRLRVWEQVTPDEVDGAMGRRGTSLWYR